MPKLRISWDEYRSRQERLREFMTENEYEAFLVTTGVHIFYLSHFYHMITERPAALLVTMDEAPIFMGPRLEADHLRHQTQLIDEVYTYLDYPGETHPIELFAEWLKDMGYGKSRIGAENPSGAGGSYGYEGPSLEDEMPDAEIVKEDRVIWDMRMVKSEEEIELIKESARWGNLAHSLLQEYTEPGYWDVEISLMASLEASSFMKKTLGPDYEQIRGGRAPASAGFRGQVGWKSAMPHSIGINKMVEEGDVLVTGAGADIGGYHSELERTMIIGEPTERQRKLFNVMVEAQDAAINALGPGVKCSEIDDAANRVLHDAGLKDYIRHHTGHGIGLQGHEPPWLDQGNNKELKPGMVVSIEPGIYELGFAGFRHSDTAVITEDGAELVTYYPRDIDSLTIT
ncbi:MAG: M24 family metallopeptidase [Candidatus Bathyarchaeia archaeon]